MRRGVMHAAVVPIPNMRAFSDDEALAWLRDNGPVQMSNAALARAWGWNATKVSRRLKAWNDAGLIERAPAGIIAAPPRAPVPADPLPTAPLPAEAPPTPALPAVLQPPDTTPVRGKSTLHPIVVLLAAPLLTTAALALGGVGLV